MLKLIKMKKHNYLYSILIVSVFFTIACNQSNIENRNSIESAGELVKLKATKVNFTESKVKWKGEILGYYYHTGAIDLKDAKLELKDGSLVGGSFIVDMNTIKTTDNNYDIGNGSTPERLISHIASSDFFDVKNFPIAKFEIKEVKGDEATGMLSIRGITHEEKVENISLHEEDGKEKLSGNLLFNHKKYNVSWQHPVKEKVLSEDIKIEIELVLE